MEENVFEISHYYVRLGLSETQEALTPDGEKTKINIFGRIYCKGLGGQIIHINFFRIPKIEKKESSAAQCCSHIMSDGKPLGEIFEPEERYPFFVDLLRNEKPLKGCIITGDEPLVQIYTGEWEPVGVGDEDYKR